MVCFTTKSQIDKLKRLHARDTLVFHEVLHMDVDDLSTHEPMDLLNDLIGELTGDYDDFDNFSFYVQAEDSCVYLQFDSQGLKVFTTVPKFAVTSTNYNLVAHHVDTIRGMDTITNIKDALPLIADSLVEEIVNIKKN